MSVDNSASLIALLSLLQEKKVLDKVEISEIKRHGDLASILVAKGLVTQEEIEDRYEDVREVIQIASVILRGVPPTASMLDVLRSRRDAFPALVDEIFKAMEVEGEG